MMPMSKQTWSDGEKYLALRILFIYVLIFLVYVCPFLSLHYHAQHATPRAVIYEQYQKMVQEEQRASEHKTRPHHHAQTRHRNIMHT